MSDFVAAGYLNNAARTEAEIKQAFEDNLKATKQIPGAGVAEQALTIASGSVTPASGASGIISIDTEAAAATDDLANIVQTNLPDGSLLWVRCVSATRVPTVKHSAGGAGQISLLNGADLPLTDASQFLLLKRTGALWQEVGYFTLSTGTGKFVRQTSPTLTSPTVSGALTQAVGANVASASTINLTTVSGNACHVTGTTTITAVTLATGKFCEVIFDGALTLTHHATNNNLPGAANITTAAGDRALYWSDGTTVYCLRYTKAAGTSVVGTPETGTWGSDLAGGTRVIGTSYQNTSGKKRRILITCYGAAPGAINVELLMDAATNPPTTVRAIGSGESDAAGSSRHRVIFSTEVPSGWYYKVNNASGGTLGSWFELDE